MEVSKVVELLPPAFWVDRVPVAGVSVVDVHGELDLAVAGQVSCLLNDVLKTSETVLIDLSSCSFIDSAGLSAILAASRNARTRDVRLAVAARPGGAPRALFDLVIGHSVFVCCDDRSAGLAALRRAS